MSDNEQWNLLFGLMTKYQVLQCLGALVIFPLITLAALAKKRYERRKNKEGKDK